MAIESRAEADLGLGRYGELAGELEARCREHLLRERLWELLILALYRSGRQAEALRAYTEIRDRLVGELGTDPGPALRELQARILSQDPSLGPASAPPRPARLRLRWSPRLRKLATREILRCRPPARDEVVFAQRVGITDAAAHRLRELVDQGLLEKSPYRPDGGRTRMEYRLTAKGRDLLPAVLALMQWGGPVAQRDGRPPRSHPRRLR